jgi:putative acetyltransferase
MEEGQVGITIRWATPDDSAAIASILSAAFIEYKPLYTDKGYSATTPTAQEIQTRFENGLTLVAVSSAEIVGTVSMLLEDNAIYIRSMAIIPKARGQRLGERLLRQLEDFAVENGYKRLRLSTTPFLDRAIRLYEQFGFNRVGIDDLYGTPLITMEKTL